MNAEARFRAHMLARKRSVMWQWKTFTRRRILARFMHNSLEWLQLSVAWRRWDDAATAAKQRECQQRRIEAQRIEAMAFDPAPIPSFDDSKVLRYDFDL